jgi:hypothetical protein
MIQWTGSIPGTGNGKGSSPKTNPITRAARKRRGGRAMTPAVPVSVTCCLAGSISMCLLPQMLEATKARVAQK